MINNNDKNTVSYIRTQIPGILYSCGWFIMGMSISYTNKMVFAFTDFSFPVLLSCIHLVINGILCQLLIRFTNLVKEEDKTITYEAKKSIRYFVLIFCLNIAFGNISLRIVDLALSQTLRATIPVFSLVLSYFFLGQTTSKYVIMSLIPVMLGVALMSLTNIQFSAFNAAIIFIGIFLCSFKGVLTHFTLKEHKIHPIVLLANLAPISAVVMFVLSIVLMDIPNLIKNFRNIFLSENVLINTLLPLFSAFVAFGLNIISFLANRGTSPLTMSVLGNIKQVTIILSSIVIFNTEISFLGLIGIVVAFVGLLLYSLAKYHHQKSKKVVSDPNQEVVMEESDDLVLEEILEVEAKELDEEIQEIV